MKRRGEEKLRQAKARSYCAACKRRGHWHRDPECPLRGKLGTSHARARTMSMWGGWLGRVTGHEWHEKYCLLMDSYGTAVDILEGVGSFKFGASRVRLVCNSRSLLQGEYCSGSNVAVVPCRVPLLFSRPVLSGLGMRYDLAAQKVDLTALWPSLVLGRPPLWACGRLGSRRTSWPRLRGRGQGWCGRPLLVRHGPRRWCEDPWQFDMKSKDS